MRISKSGLFIIFFIIGTYIIWFIFFQEVIQYILNNAIDADTGEKDIVTSWIGIFILPLLVDFCLLGIFTGIYVLIKRVKKNES
ncbi:MAG: hypothetical protein ACFFDH_03765 [Promethearchaeota archaeon]